MNPRRVIKHVKSRRQTSVEFVVFDAVAFARASGLCSDDKSRATRAEGAFE